MSLVLEASLGCSDKLMPKCSQAGMAMQVCLLPLGTRSLSPANLTLERLHAPGLSDTSILGSVEAAVEAAAATLQHSKGIIVLSGCGTSGRMAFWVAKAFNKVLQTLGLPPRFRYLMSGGDTALLLSDELPEVPSTAPVAHMATHHLPPFIRMIS